MVKLVISDYSERLHDLYKTGLTKIFLEFNEMMECKQNNKHHMYTVGEHSIVAMRLNPSD